MYKQEKSQLEIFSKNLRQIMADKELSQHELSRKLGCSVPTVNSWCQGQTMPRRELFEKLCQTLNVTRLKLLTDAGDIANLTVPAAHPLRILGTICAGDGILANESFDGFFFVDNSIRADYCLRVEGDSMKDANIFHGDVAFIRKSYDIHDGGIYAVVFGDYETATLKQVYRQDVDTLILMPCNPKYKQIIVRIDDVLMVGECVGVYHPR